MLRLQYCDHSRARIYSGLKEQKIEFWVQCEIQQILVNSWIRITTTTQLQLQHSLSKILFFLNTYRYFTNFRYKNDWYSGHSWASGLYPSGNYPNIESTSEVQKTAKRLCAFEQLSLTTAINKRLTIFRHSTLGMGCIYWDLQWIALETKAKVNTFFTTQPH